MYYKLHVNSNKAEYSITLGHWNIYCRMPPTIGLPRYGDLVGYKKRPTGFVKEHGYLILTLNDML